MLGDEKTVEGLDGNGLLKTYEALSMEDKMAAGAFGTR